METCFEYLIHKDKVYTRKDGTTYPYGTFFTDEDKWIRRVLNWLEEYPEDVRLASVRIDAGDRTRVIRRTADKEIDLSEIDVSKIEAVNVNMPIKWFRVAPPRQSTLTEEQRQIASERMRKLRQEQLQGKQTDENLSE